MTGIRSRDQDDDQDQDQDDDRHNRQDEDRATIEHHVRNDETEFILNKSFTTCS